MKYVPTQYKKNEVFVITPVQCHCCGSHINFSYIWRMTKVEGRLKLKRSHQYVCKSCAPLKHQFVAYFYNLAMQDAMAADKIVYEQVRKNTKSIKKQVRMAQAEKPRSRGNKCPCGSKKKAKNCCHKSKR